MFKPMICKINVINKKYNVYYKKKNKIIRYITRNGNYLVRVKTYNHRNTTQYSKHPNENMIMYR